MLGGTSTAHMDKGIWNSRQLHTQRSQEGVNLEARQSCETRFERTPEWQPGNFLEHRRCGNGGGNGRTGGSKRLPKWLITPEDNAEVRTLP
jgi:hypothetical protein